MFLIMFHQGKHELEYKIDIDQDFSLEMLSNVGVDIRKYSMRGFSTCLRHQTLSRLSSAHSSTDFWSKVSSSAFPLRHRCLERESATRGVLTKCSRTLGA